MWSLTLCQLGLRNDKRRHAATHCVLKTVLCGGSALRAEWRRRLAVMPIGPGQQSMAAALYRSPSRRRAKGWVVHRLTAGPRSWHAPSGPARAPRRPHTAPRTPAAAASPPASHSHSQRLLRTVCRHACLQRMSVWPRTGSAHSNRCPDFCTTAADITASGGSSEIDVSAGAGGRCSA